VVSTVKHSPLSRFVKKLLPHRLWVQTAFLLVWLDPLALRMHTLCGPVFHCYACPLALLGCPIGVIAQFSALHMVPYFAIGLLITVGIFIGAIVCGWMCPFGLLQDLAAKIPTPRLKIPRWMGHFRYVVLVGAVIAVPYFFGEGHPLFICRICPAGGLEKALPDVVSAAVAGETIVWPNAIKITVIVVFIGAIFVTIRPWCRILCPLGAIFGFFNRFSLFTLDLKEHKCTKCSRCRTLCTYGIHPDKTPNADNCLRCLECTRCGPAALTPATLLDEADPQP
jgi:polyferredoxin